MADFIPDPPKSYDNEARQLLALNAKLQTSKPRSTSNGSVAKGGTRQSTKMAPRGGVA